MRGERALVAFAALSMLAAGISLVAVRTDRRDSSPTPSASVTPSPSAAPPSSPSPTPTGPPLANLPVELREVAKAVERLRGLTFLEPVHPELLTPQQMTDRLIALFDAEADPTEVAKQRLTLTLLGLIPPNFDLLGTAREYNRGAVAGFYEEDTGELVIGVRASGASPAAKFYLAHELTHAVTDQHFDLNTLDQLESDPAQADAALAYRALVEGDASILATRYLLQELDAEDQRAAAAELNRPRPAAVSDVPTVIDASFSFAYSAGSDFVGSLLADGGWRAVDAAYRDPPSTTEQVLHVAKYRSREPGKVVAIDGWLKRLGWRTLTEGVIGEVDLRVILDGDDGRRSMLSDAASEVAAEGWGGGVSATVARGDAHAVLVATRFDGSADLTEARRAFERWLPLRFGGTGDRIDVAGGRGWRRNGEGAGAVVIDGQILRVVVADSEGSLRKILRAA